MARKGKGLTGIEEFEKSNTKTEQSNGTVNSNSKTEQLNDADFLKQFKEKVQKPTIEDTHTRQTYLIRNDLLKRMNKAAKGKKRGFKTDLVNFAIEKVLDELEEK